MIAEMPEENKDVMYDIGDMNDPQLKIAYDVAVEKLPVIKRKFPKEGWMKLPSFFPFYWGKKTGERENR